MERTMLIQKQRLKRGWSQQQLADASGLSVRTIQRIEAGQPASTETLKSIAAVFEVDFSTLSSEEPQMATATTVAEKEEREAFDYVRKLRGFYIHLIQYVAILGIMLAINLLVSPHHLWVLWVAGGWGLGLAMHALRVFQPYRPFGPQWERQQVERRLGRPL
jgi:transcriptional regulator with XRE-family HTH domain